MPGAVTHLKAAYLYNSMHNDFTGEELSLYYLGSISPDAVNLKGHAEKKIRWSSHLRNSDLDLWLENVRSYYSENKLNYPIPYLQGYLIHIITDIVWDKYFEIPLFNEFDKYGIKNEEKKHQRWQELDFYENEQRLLPWYDEVKRLLERSFALKICSVSAEEINSFKNMVINRGFVENTAFGIVDEHLINRCCCIVFALADDIFGLN